MMLRHDRHWIEILVAFALMPEADMTIPGILTRRDTVSDCNIKDDSEIYSKNKGFKVNTRYIIESQVFYMYL